MTGQAAVLPLVLLLAVFLLAADKGGTLRWLPFKLAWAGLRWLGFRPRHLPGLAATALLVFQAAPTIGWRLPLVLVLAGWLVWLHRPGGGRSPRWLRRAERAYADALRDAAKATRGQTRTQATPKPTRPTRPTTPTPTRPTTPTPARPAAGPAPREPAKPRRARPASTKPAASAPYWTPPPLAAEPVWPRWLGGGRFHKRRDIP